MNNTFNFARSNSFSHSNKLSYERLLVDYIGAFNAAAISTYLPPEPDWEKANELTMEIAGAYL